MSCFEQIDLVGCHGLTGTEAGELVATKLLADKLVERLVGVDRADDIITVAVGQRAIGVGTEVAVRIGIARGIEPVLSPTLTKAS